MRRREDIGTHGLAWAVYDDEEVYRYALGRSWDSNKQRCSFIMLNPSTATEQVLDPTVARCLSFAKAWGYGSMEVGNIFALRSTDPKALYTCPNPIGPENDEWLLNIQKNASLLICAWGVHGEHLGRGAQVKTMLGTSNTVRVLGLTKAGHPRHPLYLARSTEPQRWR